MKSYIQGELDSSHDQVHSDDAAPGSFGPRAAGALAKRVRLLARFVLEHFGPGSVWGPPMGRIVFGGALLCVVAYVGHISSRLEQYGPLRRFDDRVIALAEQLHDQSQTDADRTPKVDVNSAPQSAEHLTEVSGNDPTPPLRPGCPETDRDKTKKGITDDGRVILNEASLDELTTLPGIGKARAGAIIDLRTRLGGFKKIADLLRIRGIGWKSLQKLKEKILLDRPVQAEPKDEPVAPASVAPVSAAKLVDPAKKSSEKKNTVDDEVRVQQTPTASRELGAPASGAQLVASMNRPQVMAK